MKHRHNINTVTVLYIVGLTLSSFLFVGCQKKCQQAGPQLTTITDQEFRLVKIGTNDATIKNLTNTNFETMTFFKNYTGEVHKVQNNERFNDPSLVFSYNVDPSGRMFTFQFSTPASSGANGGASVEASDVGRIQTFSYKLTNELQINDQATHWNYRFVPFEGIVLPDQQCTF